MPDPLEFHLRAHRLRSGRSLDSISAETRIPVPTLLALETFDLDGLPPASVVIKAYVRAYSRALGLEGEAEREVLTSWAVLLDARDRETAAAAALERAQGGVGGLFYRGVVVLHLPFLRWRTCILSRARSLEEGAERVRLRAVDALARAGRGLVTAATRAGRALQRHVAAGIDHAQRGGRALRAASAHRYTLAQAAVRRRQDQMWVGFQRLEGRAAGAIRRGATRGVHEAAASSEILRRLVRGLAARWAGAVEAAGRGTSQVCSAVWRRPCSISSRIERAGRMLLGLSLAGVPAVSRTMTILSREVISRLGAAGRAVAARLPLIGSHRRAPVSGGAVVPVATSAVTKRVRATWRVCASRLTAAAAVTEARRGELWRATAGARNRLRSVIGTGLGRIGEWLRDASNLSGPPRPMAYRRRGAVRAAAMMDYSAHRRLHGRPPRPSGSVRLPSNPDARLQRAPVRPWARMAPYFLAVTLAALLAMILGHAPLFTSTMLGRTGLTAARLVQFFGLGAALVLFWVMGWRVAAQVPDVPILPATVRRLLTPLVTLVTLSGLYKVVLLVAEPFLGRDGRHLYDWTFILAIVAAAVWVTAAGFWVGREAPVSEADVESEPEETPDEAPLCPICRMPRHAGARACRSCGATLT